MDRRHIGVEVDLGAPLQVNNIADQEFAALTIASGVPRISIHGLRRRPASCSPLGSPERRVAEAPSVRMFDHPDVYAHVLPGQEREATRKLAALLHRK